MTLLKSAIEAIIATVTKADATEPVDHGAVRKALGGATKVLKVDEDQRIVWGWASVVTEGGEAVVDKQADIISPELMVKAATAFMLDARMAKAMHTGAQVGEVVHSFPLTKELADAFGLTTDREGWIIAMKVHDDDVWAKVKTGEYGAFSIGGMAAHETA